MKNVVIGTIAGLVLAVGGFFVGSEANTDKVVKQNDPVEHCVFAALREFPTPQGKQLNECKELSENQKKEANDTVMGFLDKVAEYEMTH